eukprot:4935578-Prymnesium_polylepis.1
MVRRRSRTDDQPPPLALPPPSTCRHRQQLLFHPDLAGIPANADSVLKIDPFAQEVSTIPFAYSCHHRADRKYKYLGGVLGPDGRIYCVPSDADYVLRIDPETCSATEIGPEIGTRATHCHISHNCNKWQNGFLAPDGLIYAIPLKASAVLRIDPLRDTVDVVGGPFIGFEKWEGGVLSRLGAMYCMPLNSKKILKINPKGDGIARACDEDAQLDTDTGDDDAEGAAATPVPDALLGHLSTGTALGQQVREGLLTDGYVVLRGVLSAAECESQLERMWAFVTAFNPSVVRDEPATWYPARIGGADPWPHTRWRSFSDMFQGDGAGWLFGELRELLAQRVFEAVYGTRELHASKEGFTFHRPTVGEMGARHPCLHKTSYVCGQPSATAGEHFDQGAAEAGLQYIQSATAFLDQDAEDACFLCWPRSHEHHQRLTSGTWRGRSHWVPLTDAELDSLRAAGLAPKRVPVSRGDVILWRSDLVHCGTAPKAERPNMRAVAYVSMRPASLTPKRVLLQKVEAYQWSHTSDHCPSREQWHEAKAGPKADAEADTKTERAGLFADGPPAVTMRQAELYGLVSYEGLATQPKIVDTPS